MKKTIFLVLISLLYACNGPQKSENKEKVLDDTDREKLTYLKEVEWPKAYREQDTVLLDRILGEDFQMIDNSGKWYTKADELEWIKKNATQNDSFHYEIKRLDILPNGTALICGTGHIVNDSTKSIYQSSNILIKRGGVWKAVSSHVSGHKELE
ncbi:MAG: nuclear transport factor 2 family protein [Aurantibacter sp.]